MADPSTSEIRVTLPGASAPVTLPRGWSRGTEPGDTVTIVSPEGDLRIAFVIVPLEGTPEEMAAVAWRAFAGSFDFAVLNKIPMPGAGGRHAVKAFLASLHMERQAHREKGRVPFISN